MSRRRYTNFASAFTLIEIMIAIGILSMVLAAIYSSWTAILRSSKVGLETAASIQRARITVRVLEDSLGSAQAFVRNPPMINFYGFEAINGDDASLSFVARLEKSFPRGGKFGDFDVRRLTFSLEGGPDNSRQLVLRQCPILMDWAAFDEEEHPLVLAKNVQSFEFQFWDQRLGDWIDEWKQTNQIPHLVMVSLKVGQNAHSREGLTEITRFIQIPSMAIQPGWQPTMLLGSPGAPGATPPGGANPPGTPPPPGQFQTGPSSGMKLQ